MPTVTAEEGGRNGATAATAVAARYGRTASQSPVWGAGAGAVVAVAAAEGVELTVVGSDQEPEEGGPVEHYTLFAYP